MFLDEVSKVKNWPDGIKRLKDRRKLDNATVILTGSYAIDLKKSLENLAGRRGKTNEVYDKVLLPMKFSEYVSVMDAGLKKQLIKNKLLKREDRIRTIKKLLRSEIDSSLDRLQPQLASLNSLLLDYMLTGGIPQVVSAYYDRRYLDEYLYTTYLDYVLGDLKSLRRSPIIVGQLASNIIKNLSWPQSWLSLQKDTDIRNPITAGEYVHALDDMFVLTFFYHYDPEKKRPVVRKNKKIHFHDPFFLHSLNGWISSGNSFRTAQNYVRDATNQGPLVEGIVGDHLARLAFELSDKKQNFDYHNHLFYWNKKKETEVDYIVKLGGFELPVEVKFQNTIRNKDLRGIRYFSSLTKARNSVMLSKSTMEKTDDAVVLPAAFFLLLI